MELGGDIDFTIELTDMSNTTTQLNISQYAKVSPPYPKGTGVSSDDSVIDLCLKEGVYNIEMGGSTYPVEMSIIIPGHVGGGVGEYEFT